MINIKQKFSKIDRNIELLLALLKSAIMEDFIYPEKYVDENTDWEYIFALARSSNVDGLLYYVCLRNPRLKKILSEHSDQWKDHKRVHHIKHSYKSAAIKQIIAEAENDNVKLVFFKGLILADLYPQFDLRPSKDTDIFVYEKDKAIVTNILYRLGYEKNEEHSKNNVPVFVSRKMNHLVEIHYSLWEDYEGRRINILDKMGLTEIESLIELDACNIKLTTLGHEEHLIYQMFHLIKHFVTDSIGIRYLVDITLFVNKYGDSIDYQYFWESMRKLGYSKFCMNFLRLCVKYFNMKSSILLELTYEDDGIEEALLLDMIHKGELYEHKTSPWQILGIMTPYLVGEEKVPVTGVKRKIKVLFPSSKALPEKFGYAKNNKMLLPIAWIHKIIDFMLRYNTYNKIHKDWYNPLEKLEVAEYRLQLIKKLEL